MWCLKHSCFSSNLYWSIVSLSVRLLTRYILLDPFRNPLELILKLLDRTNTLIIYDARWKVRTIEPVWCITEVFHILPSRLWLHSCLSVYPRLDKFSLHFSGFQIQKLFYAKAFILPFWLDFIFEFSSCWTHIAPCMIVHLLEHFPARIAFLSGAISAHILSILRIQVNQLPRHYLAAGVDSLSISYK